jgi:hypothetical protein
VTIGAIFRASSAAAAAAGVELFAIAVMYEINFNPVAFHVRSYLFICDAFDVVSGKKSRSLE